MSMEELNDIRMTVSRTSSYDPSEIVLIGTHMPPADEDVTNAVQKCRTGKMKVHSDLVEELTLTCGPEPNATEGREDKEKLMTTPTVAVIYAYSYEGHIYRLPRPRIMVVRGCGSEFEPDSPPALDQDTGNEAKPSKGPAVGKLYTWRIGKHQMSISIEVETGTFQSLVLEANTPGNQSQTSYHSHMQMAHRGGRLT